MSGYELGSRSKPVCSQCPLVIIRSVHFPPHFVAFLRFKDFEDLFGLNFGRINHDCAGTWM